MIKKAPTDEIDLLDLTLVIWKGKWKVVFIALIILALTIIYQLISKPGKVLATTEIRPISVYDEAKYKIYNAFTKEITFNSTRSFPKVNLKELLMESPQSEEITTNFIPRDQKVVNITDLKIRHLDINNVNKEFLFELFLEKIEQKSNLAESLIKFNFIKKEDYPNNEAYNKAVIDLASSISFKEIQSENKKSIDKKLSPIVIQFKGYNVENWEKFLKFLEKKTNLEIQKKLSEMFTDYIEYVKTIKRFELEDIDVEISTALSENEKKILKEKKNFLNQNKYIERMQDIFSSSPISNSEKFYAAKIIYESTDYKTKKKASLKTMLLVGGIFGLILGILYVLVGNAIQNRR